MKRRRWMWVGSSVFLLLGVAYFLTCVELYTTVDYVCENTGSHYGYLLWPGGFHTGAYASKSPLETFLVTRNLDQPVQHRWSQDAYEGTTVLGKPISFADAQHGGMVYLQDADLQKWMDHHSQAEIVGLYEFFCKSSQEQSKKRAVEILRELDPDAWPS